jgi:RNA recognition motif-containing protein
MSEGKRTRPSARNVVNPTLYSLYFSNLPFSMTSDDLLELVLECGRPSFCQVVTGVNGESKGCGYVSYEDARLVHLVIRELNGISVGGRNIIVKKANLQAMAKAWSGTSVSARIYTLWQLQQNSGEPDALDLLERKVSANRADDRERERSGESWRRRSMRSDDEDYHYGRSRSPDVGRHRHSSTKRFRELEEEQEKQALIAEVRRELERDKQMEAEIKVALALQKQKEEQEKRQALLERDRLKHQLENLVKGVDVLQELQDRMAREIIEGEISGLIPRQAPAVSRFRRQPFFEDDPE